MIFFGIAHCSTGFCVSKLQAFQSNFRWAEACFHLCLLKTILKCTRNFFSLARARTPFPCGSEECTVGAHRCVCTGVLAKDQQQFSWLCGGGGIVVGCVSSEERSLPWTSDTPDMFHKNLPPCGWEEGPTHFYAVQEEKTFLKFLSHFPFFDSFHTALKSMVGIWQKYTSRND